MSNTIALEQGIEKIIRARPGQTIPFFFEKGDKKYMGRAQVVSKSIEGGHSGETPNYHVNIFDVTDGGGVRLSRLKEKAFARTAEDLQQQLFTIFNGLK